MKSLLLTDSCKLNCKYCYQKEFHKNNKMNLIEIKKIFGNFKENEFIHLFGGEPFNNLEVIEWISKQKKYCFKITTNIFETNLLILENFFKNNTLKKLILSLDVLNSYDRYDKNKEIIIFEKLNKIISLSKKYNFKELEFHFVFRKIHFDKMFANYKFFSNISLKEKINIEISYNLDTEEEKSEEDINLILKEYKKIIDYDFKNFYQIKFKTIKPKKYRFCEALGQETYFENKKINGCPRMLHQEKNYKIKEKCLKCKNEYCYSCIIEKGNVCIYFNKLKSFLKELNLC